MRIAVLWSRFGPYHLARLEGLARAAAGTAAVLGMETASIDAVYAWDRVEHAGDRARITLFPDNNYDEISRGRISSEVQKKLDAEGIDVVAVNGWSVSEARAALAWRRKRPRKRVVLMSETKEDDQPRVWWKERVKKYLVKHADTALVGGRKQGEYLQQLGIEEDRIFLGYDVVDNGYFEAGSEEARRDAERLRARLALPARYFCCCTRFLERKNVDGLLQAYKRYRESCSGDPWGLVILGSGEQADRLKTLCGELAPDEVSWPGFVQYESLPVYYGLASAFIHPAKSEPWGLVVNEAAASGLPLLVSRTVGARYELVKEGENGFLFDPFDVDDMARSMVRVAELDDAARAGMGARSREIVSEWSPRRFGEQLLAASELALSLPDR